MNKKRLLLVLSLICLLFLMTGCVKTNPDGTVKQITDASTIEDVKEDGFLTVLLVFPLAKAINFLEPKVGVFAAIALVTVAINALVLVLTFKANVSMQRMQLLQPELNKIQKKYEGRTDAASQQRQAAEMQKLYEEYDVHPLKSLLATFVQFPILIAMYSAVRSSSAVTNSEFMGVSLQTTPMEGFKALNIAIILIYVLMVVSQFISMQVPQILANKKAKLDAELHHKHYEKPKNQNVMMTYGMLIMISFVMLSWPTALSLYYFVSSAINILKTLAINKLSNK